MRVVSLLPAATEIVCALGLRDKLVARSHECDFPAGVEPLPALTRARVDSSLPSAAIDEQVRKVVESRLPIYTLDEATLAALRPDVVVTQEACEVCAISYDQVVAAVRRASADAQVIALTPTRLEHIIDDVRRVAAACGVSARGEAVAGDLGRRLARVPARGGGKPRVAVIEWLAPVMLAGHWVPDSIRAAGGIALGPEPGHPSSYTTWDSVRALRPDAVIVAPCGFDLDRTIRESAPFATALRELAPRVLLLDGNAYLNRPGPRIVEAVETIAGWLFDGFVAKDRGADMDHCVEATNPRKIRLYP
jgi:iron complex transport system substrate-binding protein